MATSATPSKLSAQERILITQALDYFHKGSLRAITSSKDPDIRVIHENKARAVAALTVKLSNNELDL